MVPRYTSFRCDASAPLTMRTPGFASILAAFDCIPEVLLLVDSRGQILFANPHVEELFGYQALELVGRNVDMLIAEPFRERYARAQHALLEGLKDPPAEEHVCGMCKDGRTLHAELRLGRFPARDVFIVSFHDASKQDELRGSLCQSQKIQAMGALTNGVAHDFNNVLTVINGYAEIACADVRLDENTRSLLTDIKKAGERAASLTRQLLAFTRRTLVQPRQVNLNTAVTDIAKMLRRLVGENIALNTVLEPHLADVHVDPGQIDQILLNLAVNARDAMPVGGELTIETANVQMPATDAHDGPDVRLSWFVLLSVRDTGCGMDEETQARIFEPFFTTKSGDKGTGLGLAIIDTIVKENGGYVEVSSAPNRGTTFKVFLPRAINVTSASAELPEATEHHPRPAKETVVVLEDDHAVRRLISRVLTGLGYRVLEAEDGREALHLFRSNKEIDLLVADLILPDMNGLEVAEAVLAEHPGLGVLFISGYPEKVMAASERQAAGISILLKPFTPPELARGVRKILDG